MELKTKVDENHSPRAKALLLFFSRKSIEIFMTRRWNPVKQEGKKQTTRSEVLINKYRYIPY